MIVHTDARVILGTVYVKLPCTFMYFLVVPNNNSITPTLAMPYLSKVGIVYHVHCFLSIRLYNAPISKINRIP